MANKIFNNGKNAGLFGSVRFTIYVIGFICLLLLDIFATLEHIVFLSKKTSSGKLELINPCSRNLSDGKEDVHGILRNENESHIDLDDYVLESGNDASNNVEGNNNITEEDLKNYDHSTLRGKCREFFPHLSEEKIDEMINLMHDSVYRKYLLETWLELCEDEKRKTDDLKNELVEYLEQLRNQHNVSETVAQEEMNKSYTTIDSTVRITQNYYSQLFYYYIVKKHIPDAQHDYFINVTINTFNAYLDELLFMGKQKLNKSVIAGN
ncbi:Plasmodium exported protein, unknown function [Plasmodium ovale]|uniref:Plasmodium RESA N-terminal domain-containing protein n=2 Tax=Plasmodium ovale TaxID=36330 RepID=A0A1A8W3J8_PLAOA|nr:hypothetical protein (PHIST) [Plasmodium ovale curtisi]SBS99385.1 hypothetical protein (PHIST) [Plasmodium ovale curtisi]SBT83102.1 Plasmodium exported protein, unknown function [Plasmodium ovale]